MHLLLQECDAATVGAPSHAGDARLGDAEPRVEEHVSVDVFVEGELAPQEHRPGEPALFHVGGVRRHPRWEGGRPVGGEDHALLECHGPSPVGVPVAEVHGHRAAVLVGAVGPRVVEGVVLPQLHQLRLPHPPVPDDHVK